ncbi:hypothetical protein [Paucibacter soli]|uniref:hypothetical protein n=1 Tax=Paucibacter soli TaxID=3133433 RepID=UPI0030A6B74E
MEQLGKKAALIQEAFSMAQSLQAQMRKVAPEDAALDNEWLGAFDLLGMLKYYLIELSRHTQPYE